MWRAAAPDDTLLAFLQSTYDAAADLGAWNRTTLEREDDSIGSARQRSIDKRAGLIDFRETGYGVWQA